MNVTILIIGATGVFGRRLAAHLARTEGYDLVFTSRSLTRATSLADDIKLRPGTKASVSPAALDIKTNLETVLQNVRPTLVIDCSGPFQSLDYQTPLAVAGVGAHFVDLADARGYIIGFQSALDTIFRSKNLVALTGASSSPALAASVVSALSEGWRRLDKIEIVITPGGQSEVGEAAVAAALSYCGQPVPIVAGGKLSEVIGWGELRRMMIKGLEDRTVAPVETADAELLSQLYPTAASIRFWAGLESSFEMLGLRLLSGLRRCGLFCKPMKFRSLLTKARRLTRITTGATGVMCVRTIGINHIGEWAQAEWQLIARQNQGPHVPPSPAAAAVRLILEDKVPVGARPALTLPLSAIEAEFTNHAIETRREVLCSHRRFAQNAISKSDFEDLPNAVKAFHQIDAPVVWRGRADIDAPANLTTRLLARIFGFPSAGRNVPVTILIDRRKLADDEAAPTETWTRCFASCCFRSEIETTDSGVTTERFGLFKFRIGLHVGQGRLYYPVIGWWLGRLPIPNKLAPCSQAFEWEDEKGRFNFDVHLRLPVLGKLAHYKGWLVPATGTETFGNKWRNV